MQIIHLPFLLANKLIPTDVPRRTGAASISTAASRGRDDSLGISFVKAGCPD